MTRLRRPQPLVMPRGRHYSSTRHRGPRARRSPASSGWTTTLRDATIRGLTLLLRVFLFPFSTVLDVLTISTRNLTHDGKGGSVQSVDWARFADEEAEDEELQQQDLGPQTQLEDLTITSSLRTEDLSPTSPNQEGMVEEDDEVGQGKNLENDIVKNDVDKVDKTTSVSLNNETDQTELRSRKRQCHIPREAQKKSLVLPKEINTRPPRNLKKETVVEVVEYTAGDRMECSQTKEGSPIQQMEFSQTKEGSPIQPKTRLRTKNPTVTRVLPPDSSMKIPTSLSTRKSTSTVTSTLVVLTLISCLTKAEEFNLERREFNPDQITNVNFTAYDCFNSVVNENTTQPEVRAIDLTTIGPCPDPVHDYMAPTEEVVTIVQTNVPVAINITHCKVEMTTTVSWNGMHSHRIRSDIVDDNRPVRIDQKTCLAMWRTKKFRVPSTLTGGGLSSPEVELKEDEITPISWYSHGGFDDDQNMVEQTFYYFANGVKKEIVGARHVIISVFIEQIQGQLDLGTKRVWSEFRPFRGKYYEGSAWSTLQGSFSWDIEEERPCEDSVAKITTETAMIHRKKAGLRSAGDQLEFAEAMMIITNETSGRASGFVLTTIAPGCSTLQAAGCLQTNIPFVVACVSETGRAVTENLNWVDDRPASRVVRLNLHGLGTYLELTGKLSDFERHKKLVEEICRIEDRLIRSDFASILNVNNQYALHALSAEDSDKETMGDLANGIFSIDVRGSVAYFLECSAIEVTLIELPVCTQQIPVVLPDRTMGFVDSINLQLVDIPKQLECTRSLPVQYKIEGSLYCHNPYHSACPRDTQPSIVQPTVSAAQGIRPSQIPAIGGLPFTNEQMEIMKRERARQEMGKVAGPILAGIAVDNSLDTNGRATSFSLGIPFTDEGVNQLKNKVASRMFFLFNIFGQWYLNIFGFTVVLSMISHFVGCSFRFYYIYRARGCGVWALKALGASIFAVGMLPALILQSVIDTAKETLAEAKDDALPPPDYAGALDRLDALEKSIRASKAAEYSKKHYEAEASIGTMHKFNESDHSPFVGIHTPFASGFRRFPPIDEGPHVLTPQPRASPASPCACGRQSGSGTRARDRSSPASRPGPSRQSSSFSSSSIPGPSERSPTPPPTSGVIGIEE